MAARRTVLLALAGVPASASGFAYAATGSDRAAMQRALDGVAASAAAGVIAEVRDGGAVWRGGSGVARLGGEQPVPVRGRFRAGSLTKPFVATVLLQLAGERRVGLDDPVERWLPGLITNGARITLRHLLQHTSGIPNYTNTTGFRALYHSVDAIVALRDRTWTPRQLLGFVDGLPALFEPGAGWTYSNTDYVLLGLVIERVCGRPYAAEVERRILRPLGLRDTELPGTRPALTGPHPHGYLPREGGGVVEPVDITRFDPSVAGAAGELVTSLADLGAFFRALHTGRLLGPAQLGEMRTALVTGKRYDYGLGLQTRRLADGTRLWGHEGDIFGYWASSWSTQDGRRQVTVATTPWGDGDFDALVDTVVRTGFATGAGRR